MNESKGKIEINKLQTMLVVNKWRNNMKFKPAPIPENERNRLLAVENTGVLDVINEEIYHIYSHLARKLTDCPLSWANVMDAHRQYNFVMDAQDIEETEKENYRENARSTSFCQYALRSTEPLIINDLTKNAIFMNHTSVKKLNGPRFYAAFPLVNSEGYILGSLCVQDKRVRRLSKETIELMKNLASKLSHQLDIQTKQRFTTAKGVLQAMTAINTQFNEISLGNAISLMRYFSNSPISTADKNLLRQLNIVDKNLRLTKESRKLLKTLDLDAGVLKRMKIAPSGHKELNNLFKALG